MTPPRSFSRQLRRGLVVLAACVALVATTGCGGGQGEPAATGPPGFGQVTALTDGDTLVVTLSGHDEKIRLVGIDTPETKKPGTPVECFGHEASARLAELVPVGTEVRVERDAEARDRYGRLLGYVYRRDDNLFVNLAMVSDGFAGQLTIAPNNTYAAQFSAAERDARTNQRGLWPRCGGNHEPADG